MKLTSDWHIHSRNSCDCACMTVPTLIDRAAQLGIEDYGLTDHLHTPFNLPDVRASRAEFLASHPGPRFHLGIEVSVVSQWELDEIATGRHVDPVYGLRGGGPPGASLAVGITQQDVDGMGLEYVVGGTHWPMYVPLEVDAVIRDYHRQNMFLAAHPLVNVVAHPWWWLGHWRDEDGMYRSDPWMGDFGRVPRSMHEEFAAAAIQHGKAVEINLCAMLLNGTYTDRFKRQYLEYLADLEQRGVSLAIGSDCHDEGYDIDFAGAAAMLESAGVRLDRPWRLPPRVTQAP